MRSAQWLHITPVAQRLYSTRQETMRRITWNIYAWPITLILIIVLLPVADRIGLLLTLDLVMSLPAIFALHFHIWDKRVWPSTFWKPYAFAFIAWELLYNMVLVPMDTGEAFDPTQFIVPMILLPLYIALFRYAFRKWNREALPNKVQEGIAEELGKPSK